MLWDPIRYAETCPSSDGACALVLGSEKVGDAAAADGRPPAWIHGTAMRSRADDVGRPRHRCCRSAARCAPSDVYRQAGITDPRREIDCVEMYVPFSWFEPMWLENLGFAEPGDGWQHDRGRRHRSSTATCR